MQLVLKEKKQETPDIVSFLFESKEPLVWKAGQFLVYTLPHENPDDRGIRRHFTIASASHEGYVMLTVRFGKDTSTFKRILEALSVGDTIETVGPAGLFTVNDPEQEHVFIAGGIGITPFRAILLDLDHKNLPIKVKLLYGNRDEQILYKNELEALAQKHDNFTIHYFIADNRIDEEAIRKHAPDLQKPLFYVSGPEPMVRAFEKMLAEMGIPKEHIKRDYFPGYEDI